jgi:hypothetical protein
MSDTARRWETRRAAYPVLVATLGLCVVGCGGSTPTRAKSVFTSAAQAATPQPAATATTAGNPSPEAEAPAPGTTLLSTSVTGSPNVITDGHGFSIVDSVMGGSGSAEKDESKITIYNAAGQQLNEIPAGVFTGQCGAADLDVPGRGRLILTELISTQPAEGIKPQESSLTLKAWSAQSAAEAWSTVVVPPSEQQPSCSSTNGSLQNFASTNDDRWGVYGSGEPSAGAKIINLDSGAITDGVKAEGVLGDYAVAAAYPPDGPGTYYVMDPGSGRILGKLTTGIKLQSVLGLPLPGPPETGGRSATFLSTDGQRLLGVVEEDQKTRVYAWSLPSLQLLWKGPAREFYPQLLADGGGVAIESMQGGATASGEAPRKGTLVGLNDRTGRQDWSIPAVEAQVCGLTNSEMMLAVNGQLATIDVKTGKQLSYSNGSCPTILPGGLGVAVGGVSGTSGSEPPNGESQTVTVTQVLKP